MSVSFPSSLIIRKGHHMTPIHDQKKHKRGEETKLNRRREESDTDTRPSEDRKEYKNKIGDSAK